LKILVVDDHALVREGLRQVLKGLDEQVEVLEAPHCARAFELAALHADLDLVLLDYHLPDMNGLEALHVFGRKHPELPIILLSGSVNPQIMRQVLARGAAGFVTKASLSSDLLGVLRRVLDGRSLCRRPNLTRPPAPLTSGRPARNAHRSSRRARKRCCCCCSMAAPTRTSATPCNSRMKPSRTT